MNEQLARDWHAMSDHAADGTPFGGGLCNCEKQAERVAVLIAAALNEAANRIDGQAFRHMFAAENKMRGPKERDEHYAAQVASEDAARIVRAAIPKPPAEPDVAARPAGRTPGTT